MLGTVTRLHGVKCCRNYLYYTIYVVSIYYAFWVSCILDCYQALDQGLAR